MNVFQELVTRELSRANARHGSTVASAHEGAAVILEEVDEYWDEVKRNQRVPALRELIQVAAMCEKVALGVYGVELAREIRGDNG